ncbi:biopolymer transporter ExbB [Halocynthiibacter styelae]|uniref:Biopolymer transporter ExbB n=1 Tax=Halocynthiibacter styelae TaxID=2761955 RepID=A0A8J7LPG6_9RHOB|nr:biopolymer transporter ExbB [Paenihalocynthiibacter styelae]MBI1493556.1 biopolymer transporter ExbB [Paenihalocynthiibacter styelae]
MAETQQYDAGVSFSHPVRQILTMLAVIGLVGFGLWVALPRIGPVFLANPWLNGFIVFVFIIGVLACFSQVVQLFYAVRWIEGFVADPDGDTTQAPKLLVPLATLLRGRAGQRLQLQISSSSASSIQDSVATRIDEARDITRYIVNLLIFLGLLGTFYGLATTIPALVDTISSLAPKDGEEALGVDVFTRLMGGLEEQLGGMGTAFASSLLGLAGSLVVGLLELFAGHGQNRFYGELEEWLSTITRLGFASGDGDSEGGADSGALAFALDRMAQQMESVQEIYTKADVSRAMLEEKIGALIDNMPGGGVSAEAGDAQTAALTRIAEGQDRLIEALSRQGEAGGPHADAESRMRLRSIDVQLLRILEEMSAGRQESIADLRAELAQVAEGLQALAAPMARVGNRRSES